MLVKGATGINGDVMSAVAKTDTIDKYSSVNISTKSKQNDDIFE